MRCRSAAAPCARPCVSCSRKGLISAGARGRLSVRHLDAKEIKDIFDVRAALESLAAGELAGRPDRADAVAELRGAVSEMERWAASNLEDRIEADLKFHRTMCHLSGNETLLHSWSSLEGSIRMSIMYAGVDRALKNMDVKRHSVHRRRDRVRRRRQGRRHRARAYGRRRSRFGGRGRLTRLMVAVQVVRVGAGARAVPRIRAVLAAR